MIDLFQAMRERRSIRKFKSQVPSKELLYELIEYAAMAPNAMNRQDWHFTIILRDDIRERLYKAVKEKWESLCHEKTGVNEFVVQYRGNFSSFIEAPVLISVDTKRPPAFFCDFFGESARGVMGNHASSCMAVQNLVLAAHARGIGTCVYTGCNAAESEIANILDIPKNRELVCLVALGYPDESPLPRKRKDVKDIVKIID